MFKKVKGTQDFLNLSLFNFLIDNAKKHFKKYNFKQIITPILEYTDLFKRSLGTETDIVAKEMFLICSKNKDENICLRPEATASIVRAFVENKIQQSPWKVFTYGPMFRYERPQKGRYREFNQISIEMIGANQIIQDAFFIKMLDRFFTDKLKLENYALLINFLGCSKDRSKFKLKLEKFLEEVKGDICKNCIERKEKNIMRIFDCKVKKCSKIYTNAPKITENLCNICLNEWNNLKKYMDIFSLSYSHEPKLVRGLDYYNKTVFEFVSHELGSQNAFCGGGRYNKLVAEIGGGEDVASIGAAIGIERTLLLLNQIKNNLIFSQEPALHIILPLSDSQKEIAFILADRLNINNITADVILKGSLKSMLRKANKMGAKYVIIIGPEEHENQEVTIKNMLTSKEQTIAMTLLIDFLKNQKPKN